MTKLLERLIFPIFILALLAVVPSVAEAQGVCNRNPDHPKCQTDPEPDPDPEPEPDPDPVDPFAWMHPDVGTAHAAGWDGDGSNMITVDNFGGTLYSGSLNGETYSRTHGDWTFRQSGWVAPGASKSWLDHTAHGAVDIYDAYKDHSGLTAVNLSFGLFDPAKTDVTADGYSLGKPLWDSIVDQAWAGTAFFAKAAGNTNGGAVDGTVRMRLNGFRPTNAQDVLNLSLIGAPGAVFVGALEGDTMASYSTIAGNNVDVQNMFLVVDVRSDITNLSGTSFAAPIVTGYAAILGEKFTDPVTFAAPTAPAVRDHLLATARTDAISGYSASIHGMGEACLSCALAPLTPPN